MQCQDELSVIKCVCQTMICSVLQSVLCLIGPFCVDRLSTSSAPAVHHCSTCAISLACTQILGAVSNQLAKVTCDIVSHLQLSSL